jgi:hypothetical protein
MTKVLAIGNSFTENATVYMPDLIAMGKADLTICKMTLGGCSLQKHWNLVRQCDLLPDVKPYPRRLIDSGLVQEPVPSTLREALVLDKWDYIVLQQVSHDSWRKETYQPYFDNLINLAKELAPQAQPIIHQTWAYRIDAPLLKEWDITQETMYAKLKENYAELAQQYGLPILPSGYAMQQARAIFKYQPDPNYNFADPKPLELPDQSKSLIVGYRWRIGNTPSGNAELAMDERHANAKGCYLTNAVWYEMFTGRLIADNPFRPEGVTEEEAAILRQTAHEAVKTYGGPITK